MIIRDYGVEVALGLNQLKHIRCVHVNIGRLGKGRIHFIANVLARDVGGRRQHRIVQNVCEMRIHKRVLIRRASLQVSNIARNNKAIAEGLHDLSRLRKDNIQDNRHGHNKGNNQKVQRLHTR